MKIGTALPHLSPQSRGLIHISEFTAQIQRGIPIPPKKSGPLSKYPFTELQIGDSFFAAGITNNGYFADAARKMGIVVTTRKVGRGVRVWRIA